MHPGQLKDPPDDPHAPGSPGGGATRGLGRLLVFVAAVPLACAGAYLAYLIAHTSRIIADIQLNPDASWAPVLARDLASGPKGGHILVGTASHFTTIWVLFLTTWVPFRDVLWDAAPAFTYLAALALVAWACWRISGRWPALLSIAIGVSATAPVLLTVMAEGIHVDTYFADAVLGAFLVFWATRPEDHVWSTRLAVVAMVVLAGTNLASDTLFLPSGLGPFFAAPIAGWILCRDRKSARMAVMSSAVTAASVALAIVVNRSMQGLGFQKTYENNGYTLASRTVAWANLRLFGHQLLALGNATFNTQHLNATQAVHLAMALAVAAAVIAVVYLLARACLASRRRTTVTDRARLLYLAYWVLSGFAVCAAFSLTAFAEGPSDSSRYVAPAFFALAATLPVAAARMGWRRLPVAIGVALFCVLSITGRQGLFVYEVAFNQNPQTIHQRPDAIAFLESQGVKYGYADYYDSHPLTRQADMKVQSYPVIECRFPDSRRLCPFFVNTRTIWYVPRANTRTFLLWDSAYPASIDSPPTPDLGTPVLTRQFGTVQVLIYDYDIAAKFAAPCPSSAPNQFFCPNTPG